FRGRKSGHVQRHVPVLCAEDMMRRRCPSKGFSMGGDVMIRIILPAALLFVGLSAATAAELKVLVAGAYDQVFQALVPEFEKQTGHTVKSEKAPAGTLKKRAESGDAFDVAIITPAVMDALIKDGKLDAQGYAKVGTVGVGVGVREGAPKPDISSVEGF